MYLRLLFDLGTWPPIYNRMPIYHNMYLVVGWPAAKVEPTHVVVLRLFSLPTSLQQLSFACEREKDSFMQFRYSLQFLRTGRSHGFRYSLSQVLSLALSHSPVFTGHAWLRFVSHGCGYICRCRRRCLLFFFFLPLM